MTESRHSDETKPAWKWTLRVGAFLALSLSLLWLFSEFGFEPLLATLGSFLAAIVYIGGRGTKYRKALDWGVAVSILLLSSLATASLLGGTDLLLPEIRTALVYGSIGIAFLSSLGIWLIIRIRCNQSARTRVASGIQAKKQIEIGRVNVLGPRGDTEVASDLSSEQGSVTITDIKVRRNAGE